MGLVTGPMSPRIHQDQPIVEFEGIHIPTVKPVLSGFREAVLQHERRSRAYGLVMNPHTLVISIWHRLTLARSEVGLGPIGSLVDLDLSRRDCRRLSFSSFFRPLARDDGVEGNIST